MSEKKKKGKIIAGIVGSTILIGGSIAGGIESIRKAEEEKEKPNPKNEPSEEKKEVIRKFKELKEIKRKNKINNLYGSANSMLTEVNDRVTLLKYYEKRNGVLIDKQYFFDESDKQQVQITEIMHGVHSYQKINNNLGFLFGNFTKNPLYKNNYGEVFLYDWRKPLGHKALKLNLNIRVSSLQRINKDFYFLVDKSKNVYLFNAGARSEDEYFLSLDNNQNQQVPKFMDYFPINDNYGYVTFDYPFVYHGEKKWSATVKFDVNTGSFDFLNWFNFSASDIEKINEEKLISSVQNYSSLPDKIINENPNINLKNGNTRKFIVYLEETDQKKQIEYLENEINDELKIKWDQRRLTSVHVVDDNRILINSQILIREPRDNKTLLLDLRKPIGQRLTDLDINIYIADYLNIDDNQIRISSNPATKRYYLLDLRKPLGQQVSNWTL